MDLMLTRYPEGIWSFEMKLLMNMLQRIGFGPKWLKWIRQCISSVKFSILSSYRCLRQGDPLSPFSLYLGHGRTKQLISDCKNGTLVFCDAIEEHMLILRVIFNMFEADSVLHISWSNIFIYPINTMINIEDLANKL
ncbi:hypothetical protein H5410_001410 [Solanum commersonii]|uniref:Uncharacterized protein n=1 Tax=Solanum commersonii TaxID=4109 RepID=A0A9J6AYN3_SOLCO|nr:hypothetical protein H5410_001410 [Solanum commersonii]